MIRLDFGRFPEAFARLKGKNGAVREYRTLLHTGSDYSFIPKVDAYRLGYTEAAYTENLTRPPNFTMLITSSGYSEGAVVKMAEVALGPFSVKDCEFVVHDLEQVAGYDVVLGLSFLRSFELGIDYERRQLTLRGHREDEIQTR